MTLTFTLRVDIVFFLKRKIRRRILILSEDDVTDEFICPYL